MLTCPAEIARSLLSAGQADLSMATLHSAGGTQALGSSIPCSRSLARIGCHAAGSLTCQINTQGTAEACCLHPGAAPAAAMSQVMRMRDSCSPIRVSRGISNQRFG